MNPLMRRMMSFELFYPLAEVKKTDMGDRNAVRVSVDYWKSQKAMMLTMTTVAKKPKAEVGFGGFITAPLSDPKANTKLEDMARDNVKKIEGRFTEVCHQLAAKSGPAYDALVKFAGDNGLTLADKHDAELLPAVA